MHGNQHPSVRMYLAATFQACLYSAGIHAALAYGFGTPAWKATIVATITTAVAFIIATLAVPRADGSKSTYVVSFGVALMSCCFASSILTGNGLVFAAGFFLGVGVGIYGLFREIDERIPPTLILTVSLGQMMLLITLLG